MVQILITLTLLVFTSFSIGQEYVSTMCKIANCDICPSTSQCIQCENNYILQIDRITAQSYCKPVQCNIQNCRTCIQDNICSICHPTFYLSEYGICQTKLFLEINLSTSMLVSTIECNITGCTSCISPNFCASCSDKLQVNYQGNACVECTVTNCNLCSSDNICYTCAAGYQLQAASTCNICNLQGCALCLNSSYCQNCSTGYIVNINTGKCYVCTYPCLTCVGNSTNYCQTCMYNFSNQSYNGVCFTCATPNCFYCQITQLEVCLQCQTNYRLKLDHTCVFQGGCSSQCLTCQVNSTCAQCKPGYAINLTRKGQCFPCKDIKCITCSSYNASICTLCNAGLYPQQDGKCIACPFTNCQTCNSTTCLSFMPNLNQKPVLYNGSVYPVVSDPGCKNISYVNPLACITCMIGYTLNSDRICVPCAYPCLQCASSSPQICLACYDTAFLNQSTCISCNQSSQCLTCSPNNLSVCTSCPTGSILNNNTLICSSNTTNNCGNFCLTCLSTNICSVCLSGYSKNLQGQCLPCINNCRVCPDYNQGLCLQCGIGFYKGNLGNCISCSAYCMNCYKHGCITCAPGFYLSPDFMCIPVCQSPCATCMINSTNICTSCLLGYTYNPITNTCQPQTSNCINQSCYYCPIGFINSGSPNYTCIQCSSNSYCARCNPNNISLCLTCVDGYYLSIDTLNCLVCPTNCAICTSSFSCNTCIAGYFLPIQSVQAPALCVACQSPCVLCFSSPNTCLSCKSGYTLNGWSCQSKFNFIFSLILNASKTEFYNNYKDLLLTLVGPLNNSNNIGAVTVTSIVTLKTCTIQGTLSTNQISNTTGAGNQFHSIQKIFSSGIISNMSIIFSQLVVSGGSIPQPDSDNINFGLILGISLPVTFIFILILVIFVYRKIAYYGPNQQDRLMYQQNSSLQIYNRSN